jgi:hypothetical protein
MNKNDLKINKKCAGRNPLHINKNKACKIISFDVYYISLSSKKITTTLLMQVIKKIHLFKTIDNSVYAQQKKTEQSCNQ